MLTTRSAAELLATPAPTRQLLAHVASVVGCDTTPAPLDGVTREALGIPASFANVRIAEGTGALRALLLQARGARPLREEIPRLAARLARHAPHQLWLAIAGSQDGAELAIACWAPNGSGDRPRVAALLVDRRRVLDSDAETLAALAAARGQLDVLTHARWLDVLGRESLTRRFYRALERIVLALADGATGAAEATARREIALLHVSRLLFLSFLEAKGWLDGDRAFLSRRFTECTAGAGGFHDRVLLPLFFGTLNTAPRDRAARARALGRIPFLNGGLFARSPVERAARTLRFSDELFGRVFAELLDRYRFTAREESGAWSEAAVDPEMLGRAFESLMASTERRAGGVYYTPNQLVERVTSQALREALVVPGVPEGEVEQLLEGHALAPPRRARLLERVTDLRVLDPACGSGAFLVHALERLAAMRAFLGDARPLSELRRAVLTSSIFGVDINPTAVWLCELRLWLSMVIESAETDPLRVPPLPNLDRHVRVGDSLLGGTFDGAPPGGRGGRRMEPLRARYARAVGRRKQSLARLLEREERGHALAELDRRITRLSAERRDLLAALRGRDLFGERAVAERTHRERLDVLRDRVREARTARRAIAAGAALPFAFPTHFPDIAARGGFDLVVGNPPWVRIHRIPATTRALLRREFTVFREAAWEAGAASARAGRGFAAQVDLASLFIERSLTLLRDDGTLALLVPAKLWRSLAGGGVRQLLGARHRVRALEDWSESPATFDAVVYPSLVLARRGEGTEPRASPPPVRVTLHERIGAIAWCTDGGHLALDASRGSPWLFAPPNVRAAFDRLAAAGPALVDAALGRPLLGVKSGCNEAYATRIVERDARFARITSGERSARVELAHLRPVLRGEGVTPWHVVPGAEHFVWPHADDGSALERLPPPLADWFAPWRRRLLARSDARGTRHWWTLFRTEGARRDCTRVVWADVARTPRAAVLERGDPTIPLNTCYVLALADPVDAYAFAALLNSPLAAAWLAVLAEPARGGYRRFLAWTIARLPIPADWAYARACLAPLTERALRGSAPGAAELLTAALRAYRLRSASVEPLLAWHTRT